MDNSGEEEAGPSNSANRGLQFEDVEVDPLLQEAADEDKARGFRRKLTNAESNLRMVNAVSSKLDDLSARFEQPVQVAPIRITVENTSSAEAGQGRLPLPELRPDASSSSEPASLSNTQVIVEVLKVVRQAPWTKLEKGQQLALISGLCKQLDFCRAFWQSDEAGRVAMAEAIIMVDLEKALKWYDKPQPLASFEGEPLDELMGLDEYNTEERQFI